MTTNKNKSFAVIYTKSSYNKKLQYIITFGTIKFTGIAHVKYQKNEKMP